MTSFGVAKAETVGTWIKDWFPNLKCTKQEIDCLFLRGPLKDALGSFLVPRFRPSNQIDVIRSNLYVRGIGNGNTQSLNLNGVSLSSPEEAKLLQQLMQLDDEKRSELEKLLERSNQLQNMDTLDHSLDVNYKRQQLDSLIQMIHYTEGIITNLTPIMETDTSIILEKTNPSVSIREIQEESIILFKKLFLDRSRNDEELQAVDKRIHELIRQVSRGISEREIVVWHKVEMERAHQLVAQVKTTVSESGFSGMKVEADRLKGKLTDDHVQLHIENETTKSDIKEMEEQRMHQHQLQFLDESINVPLFSTTDLLKLARCEELKAKIRQLRNQEQERINCGTSKKTESQNRTTTNTSHKEIEQINGMLPDDLQKQASDMLNDQQTLEKLTSSLLRTYPTTKSRLQVLTNDRREEFLETLQACPTDADFCKDPPNHRKIISDEQENGEVLQDLLHALNPNTEKMSTSFVLQYNKNESNREFIPLNKMTHLLENISAGSGVNNKNLEQIDDLIEQLRICRS